jgi:hypothetical protein
LVPEPAVEVEVVAAGLSRGAVTDIGVEGVPVVGGLELAVGSADRAEVAGEAWARSWRAGDRRPVGRA